ncbi:XisH family protein [Gloeothece verrucosa]|uniref:XisH protein n=1 Tax=Gloeothece verrucosa (strain PCC 7822) TaxID=497965 RepID=E0UBF1_GLOV7|nr:XisH family protein [Gloeothece verrucosa]ADN12783.1 XisH protein [Gloeothece verrucosa PCC 7822]
MSAKDIYHDAVKNALIKDGWTIMADSYTIKYEEVQLFADLLADKTVEAQREGEQIIVEVKSFISPSPMRDFQLALGQYIVYRTFLKVVLPQSKIYLAIGQDIYQSFFLQKAIQLVLQENHVFLIVVNLTKEEIVQWIS